MAKQKDLYSPHKTAVFALYLFGTAGVVIPYKNGNENIFLAFLVASFLGFLALILSFYAFKKITVLKESTLKKYVVKVLFFGVAIYSVYLAADSFNVFLEFLSLYVLPEVSPYILGLTFTAIVIFCSIVRITVFYKFALVTAISSLFLLVVLFILSIPQFSVNNISLLSFPNVYDMLSQSFIYFKNVFLPALILPFFEVVFSKKENRTSALKGYLCGAFMLAVCILNSLLIFGNILSSKLNFPYSEAIGTVTAGNIFFRMDGFSYFVFFISSFVKICLLIKLTTELIKDIFAL